MTSCRNTGYDMSLFAVEETFVVTSQTGLSGLPVNNSHIRCTPNPFRWQTSFLSTGAESTFPEDMLIIITDLNGKVVKLV